MLKFIKTFKNIRKANIEMGKKLAKVKEELKNATEFANNLLNQSDVRLAIRAKMRRDLKVIDYSGMTHAQAVKYYQQVQDLKDNKVLQNEIDSIINDIKEEICLTAPPEDVQMLRMSINGLLLLKENLEELPPPNDIN